METFGICVYITPYDIVFFCIKINMSQLVTRLFNKTKPYKFECSLIQNLKICFISLKFDSICCFGQRNSSYFNYNSSFVYTVYDDIVITNHNHCSVHRRSRNGLLLVCVYTIYTHETNQIK